MIVTGVTNTDKQNSNYCTHFAIVLFFNCCAAVDASFKTAGVAGETQRVASDTGKKRAFLRPEAPDAASLPLAADRAPITLFRVTLTTLFTRLPSGARCGRMTPAEPPLLCCPLKFIVNADVEFTDDAPAATARLLFVKFAPASC